jgi:hypothetical protein
MSFLKQLLNPFIEFDENKKAEAAKGATPSAPPPAMSPKAPPTPPAPPEKAEHPLITGMAGQAPAATSGPAVPAFAPSGTLSGPLPEHVQYFERLIDEANRTNPIFQGTDFKEYVDSKLDIDDITDEALRYKTAYNVLKSTGLSKEKLLSTGQEYLNLVGRDLNAFQGAHAAQYQKEVRQKEAVIQKKAEELQALTQRINALKAEINAITQEIQITKEKLDITKNSFLLAGENKQKEIQAELDKIAQYF